jgi:hypothetical protein
VSYTTLQALLAEGLGAPLSTGLLAKVVDKVRPRPALEPIYQPLLEALPHQPQRNIDETGPKDQGHRLWTWVLGAPSFTLFHIAPSRGSQVLENLLGDAGAAVPGHDYFSAYRAYMHKAPVTVQFCLAHLIREVCFLTQSTDRAIAQYGQRLLDELKALFGLIHRREHLHPEPFQRRLEQARERFLQKARRTQAGGGRGQPGPALGHPRPSLLHLYHLSRYRADQPWGRAGVALLCDRPTHDPRHPRPQGSTVV